MKIIVQNLVTEYEDTGSGDTLLFLHGWGDSFKTFDALISAISFLDKTSDQKKYRLIRLDLPGFGVSEQAKTDWNLNNYVNFIDSFIKKLNLDVSAMIGHSLGGRIVIKGVAGGIFNPQKIILIASAGIAKRKTLRNRIFKIIAKMGNLITLIPPFLFWRNALRKKMYSIIGSRDYINAGTMRRTFVQIINEDLSENAKKIKLPTLLIWGENDTETPATDGVRLSEMIVNSKIQIFENSNHFVHQEKPKEIAGLIQDFLK